MPTLSTANVEEILLKINTNQAIPSITTMLVKDLCECVLEARNFADALVKQIEAIPVSMVYCVYCGNEYPAGTPQTKSKVLYDHIKICDKHPLKDLLEIVRAFGIWRHEGMGAPLEVARLYDAWAKKWPKEFT